MKYLLDTHAFIWWMEDPALLSSQARSAIKTGSNQVYLSSAVVWEIVIKKSLAKISIPIQFDEAMKANNFQPLPINMTHALEVQNLPPLHRDPFDRILIAQSIVDGLVLISRDPWILKYPVSHLVA